MALPKPKSDWLQQFSPARLATLSDVDVASGLERARALGAEAEKGVGTAEHALRIATYAVRSASSDPAVRTRYEEKRALNERVRRARRRLQDSEREVSLAQFFFWRRRQARQDHEAAVALLAQLEGMWSETDRWLRARETEAAEDHAAGRAEAGEALKLARHRAAQLTQALALLLAEHRSRRVSALIAAAARLGELPVGELEALLAEAVALRDEIRDARPVPAGSVELLMQLRELVGAIHDEIDGRTGGGNGGGTPPEDTGDGGGDDGQGDDPHTPPRPRS